VKLAQTWRGLLEEAETAHEIIFANKITGRGALII